MATQRTAAYYTKKAAIAAEKARILAARTVSTTTTVQKRATSAYVYSSYMLVNASGDSERMLVQASTASVAKFGGPTALLLVDPATIATSISQKPRQFTPAKVHAMIGTATPVASVTEWKTRVIKYSTATAGTTQAHFSAPISGDLDATWPEISTRSKTIHDAIKDGLGSADYYRFWLSPEQMNIQRN
jgi:hypothetical protein